MSASLAHAAPMRFLIGVAASWTIVRGVAIAGWAPPPTTTPPVLARSALARPVLAGPMPIAHRRPTSRQAAAWLATAWRPSALLHGATADRSTRAAAVPALLRARPAHAVPPPGELWQTAAEPLQAKFADRDAAAPLPMLAALGPADIQTYRQSNGIADVKTVAVAARPSRFSGSAWAFVRGGGRASPVSPVGQIGGGQAGARLLYRIDRAERLAVSGRVSGTIGGIHQTEAAIGLDWKPIDRFPVHLMLDRRVAIDKGGRNAWTLGAAGGVDDVRIARGWRLDGYAEAGVVGAHRRDLYADAAARVARAIALGRGRSLAIGGGAWGAAQPGAARLDAGPSVVLRTPVAGRFVAIALDWRERVLGRAKPGSGIALTVATDF